MSRPKHAAAVFVALRVALAAHASAPIPVAPQNSGGTKKSVDFIHKPVASLSELTELVKGVKGGRLPERRLIQRLENGGVTFELTGDDIRALTAVGASSRVIDRLDKIKSAQPVKSIAPKLASLQVFCDPIDCSIAINGKGSGRTAKGKSEPILLPAGSYAVRVSADKYQAEQAEQPILLAEAADARLTFKFHPTREALEEAGRDLYQKAFTALSGESTKAVEAIRASGNLELSDRDGVQSSWGMQVVYKAPETAKFVLTRGGKKSYVALYSKGTYQWDDPPLEAASLEDALMKICQFQAASLLAQFSSRQFTLSTDRLPPNEGSENTLYVKGSPDSYVITIDESMHVKEIKTESTGLNNGFRALYGDYAGSQGAIYPRVTQLILPDRPRHGAQVTYSDLVYNPPDVSESEFTLKRGKKHRATGK